LAIQIAIKVIKKSCPLAHAKTFEAGEQEAGKHFVLHKARKQTVIDRCRIDHSGLSNDLDL